MIQNVKLTNLERIARLFGAQILPNLASLVSIPTLGLCEKFHNVFYEQQQKNLVYLEGITNCTYLSTLGAVHKQRRQLGGGEGSKIGQNCR